MNGSLPIWPLALMLALGIAVVLWGAHRDKLRARSERQRFEAEVERPAPVLLVDVRDRVKR